MITTFQTQLVGKLKLSLTEAHFQRQKTWALEHVNMIQRIRCTDVDNLGLASSLQRLGWYSHTCFDYIEADRLLDESLRMYLRIYVESTNHCHIALAYQYRGEFELQRCLPRNSMEWFVVSHEKYQCIYGQDNLRSASVLKKLGDVALE